MLRPSSWYPLEVSGRLGSGAPFPRRSQDRNRFTTDEVTIAQWGMFHETLDRALTDTY